MFLYYDIKYLIINVKLYNFVFAFEGNCGYKQT